MRRHSFIVLKRSKTSQPPILAQNMFFPFLILQSLAFIETLTGYLFIHQSSDQNKESNEVNFYMRIGKQKYKQRWNESVNYSSLVKSATPWITVQENVFEYWSLLMLCLWCVFIVWVAYFSEWNGWNRRGGAYMAYIDQILVVLDTICFFPQNPNQKYIKMKPEKCPMYRTEQTSHFSKN